MDSARLIEALQFSPLGIALIDKTERYLFASAVYAKRLGFTPENIVGRRVEDCINKQYFDHHIGPKLRQCLQGEHVSCQKERTLDDLDRSMPVRYVPCMDTNNEVWAVLNIGLDITRDYCPAGSSNSSQHDWHDRLQDPSGSSPFDPQAIQSNLEKDESLSSAGRAMAMLNHELRNPLATLAASLKMLHQHLPDTPEVGRIYSRSERAIQRCEKLTSSLLDYSKPFPIEPQKLELSQWISAVIDDYRVPHTIDVNWQPGKSCAVWLDDELMRRAVNNLLDNSVREILQQPAESNRELSVGSDLDSGKLRLIISDTGPGFPEYLLGDTAPKNNANNPNRVGYGLLIARQVIERHGGRLVLENHSAGGALAEIQLPLAI